MDVPVAMPIAMRVTVPMIVPVAMEPAFADPVPVLVFVRIHRSHCTSMPGFLQPAGLRRYWAV